MSFFGTTPASTIRTLTVLSLTLPELMRSSEGAISSGCFTKVGKKVHQLLDVTVKVDGGEDQPIVAIRFGRAELSAADIDLREFSHPPRDLQQGGLGLRRGICLALFIFGFGLYGHAVYLAELQRLHGWSTGLISNASTLSFLLGSLLAAFTSDVMVRIGTGRFLLCGIFALAASTTLLAFAETPWQLYAAYLLLACGWMGMGTVVIATIVSSWFDHRRGLAISIAFNGATFAVSSLPPRWSS